MKIPWTIVAMMAACCLLATTNKSAFPLNARTETELPVPALDEGDIQERLAQLKIPFEPRYNEEVRSLIREYITNGFRDTEAMLGRTSYLFPIFEHYLALNGLPEELKYLPIVETSLNADARSGAGAAGLWQFIPATARQYRLRVNQNVDERFDPYRSTEAAVKMLAALYEQYNDWPLVLAAYNCGPARVNSAIRNAGCRNFWELKGFLPYETQNYVPRFIAAAYIANFYSDHGLQPRLHGMEGGVRAIKVFDAFSFSDVAYASGVSVDDIRWLNPSYRSSFIPESPRGNFLLLPATAMEKFRDFLNARRSYRNIDPAMLYPNFYKADYVVRPGETIEGLARRFRVSVSDLMHWNHLSQQEVYVNQELVAFLPDKNSIAKP
ncbi:MAG: transglycosylase SLT domain-containing protein [Lewinellaceae bacterium]|nr:transglycosylase SLT domain-containing protein [Lewinellaceae bacterium]